MPDRVLDVNGLSVALDVRGRRAAVLDGVSLHVDRGETVAVVGESGAGKTALALAVMGLLPDAMSVSAGSIRLGADELVGAPASLLRSKRGAQVGMIFQDPNASLHPAFRVGAQVAESIRVHHAEISKADAHARAVALLERVGLPDASQRASVYPHQLSGGMRQRVMIAMAIANEPQLVIADEATTALDVTVQAQVLDVLRAVQRDSRAGVLLVTHDLGVVASSADRVVVMYAGRVVETGPVARVLHAPAHPYTRGLLAAVPRLTGERTSPWHAIPGHPPSPFACPAGCAFHPRCERADERCTREIPLLTTIASPVDTREVACHHPVLESPAGTAGTA